MLFTKNIANTIPPHLQQKGNTNMRKRNIEIKFRLTEEEAVSFNKDVLKSGITREAYLRHLINGRVPRDAPPANFYDFTRELHSIGNNLNQIAKKAHMLNVIDVKRYDEECRRLAKLITDVTDAVIVPAKRG